MDAKPKKTGWKLRLLLGISLGLNVLVVGALVGASFGRSDGPRSGANGPRGAESAVGIYGRALSKSERREVGDVLRSGGRQDGRAVRSELREIAQEALGILRNEEFDAAAFAEIVARQNGLLKSRAESVQSALTDYVAKMTPEARAAYADRLEASMKRGARWGKKNK